MYDLKDWFLLNLRDTHHLEGMNITNNTKVYAYHNVIKNTMVFTKSQSRFPWDLKNFDDKFIYDLGTEQGWKRPGDFKKQTSPVIMCPRYWDGDESRFTFNQHVAYDVHLDCIVVDHGDVGPAYFTLRGPFPMDFQGDVQQEHTILLTYYWGDGKHREQLFLTQFSGWVKWTHSKLTQLSPLFPPQYMIDTEVIHNKVVPGFIQPIIPPCLVLP